MKIICPKVEHRNGALEINGVLEINNVFEAYGSQTSLWIWITWAILLKCTFWFTRSRTESETAFLTRFQVIWCYRSIAQTLNSKFRSVQSLSHVRLFVTPWTAAHRASLSITNSWSLPPNSCPVIRWCHPTISSSVIPFSCPQSFPASVSSHLSQFFTSGGQSIGASASPSVLPMNIQDCFL